MSKQWEPCPLCFTSGVVSDYPPSVTQYWPRPCPECKGMGWRWRYTLLKPASVSASELGIVRRMS